MGGLQAHVNSSRSALRVLLRADDLLGSFRKNCRMLILVYQVVASESDNLVCTGRSSTTSDEFGLDARKWRSTPPAQLSPHSFILVRGLRLNNRTRNSGET